MSRLQCRAQAVERVTEMRSLHSKISQWENETANTAPDDTLLALRGLFFVGLYASFEFSVSAGVREFLRTVRATRVPYVHLDEFACIYGLDACYDSLSSAAGKKAFGRRLELVQRRRSDEPVGMADTMFDMHLQNIGSGKFIELFSWLGLKQDPFPTALRRCRSYIDELVEKRRKVSHGREAASEVGRGTRAPDLAVRIDATSEMIEHLYSSLEEHLEALCFVDEAHRSSYRFINLT